MNKHNHKQIKDRIRYKAIISMEKEMKNSFENIIGKAMKQVLEKTEDLEKKNIEK